MGTVTNSGSLQNTAGTSLHVTAASVDHTGHILVNPQGAVTFTSDLANPAGAEIRLLGGTLSAPNVTHHAGAAFTGFGCVSLVAPDGALGTLTNQGVIDLFADNQVVGDLANQAGATLGIRNGDLTVVGHLANEGTINAVNAGVYYEGGYSGGGVLAFSGAEVKATSGDMDVAPGGVVAVTGSGPTRFYANLASSGAVNIASGASAVFYGNLAGPGAYANDGALRFDGGRSPAGMSVGAINGGGTMELTGGAAVSAAGVRQGALAVGDGGTLTVRPDGTAAGASVVQALAIAGGPTPTGAIDLMDNNLIVVYTGGVSPFSDIAAWVASGLNLPGGYWDGDGITSTQAAGQVQHLTALGVIDNDDPNIKIGGLPDLEGEPTPPESVLVKYTWWGDANLDGVINSNDYDMIDTNWLWWTQEGRVPAGGFRWAVGDFNYDGTINSNDYDKIDGAWLHSGGAPLGGGMPVPMPEPATLALLALGGFALARRRRR